jgi:16S rRNA (cytidine1402-2'-O)-methyltransferase
MNSAQQSAGVLYVVATPIGNLQDLSARALDVLRSVPLIAAEDTRHSKKLLVHYGIGTRQMALHEHNERHITASLLRHLAAGEDVALVSDAGTPLISDPGFYLVRAAREANVRVVPVPGASALIAALSVAGLPSDRFLFEGFLPSKQAARQQRLQALAAVTVTLVIYESSHRICASLRDMVDCLGGSREATVARELTKTFETILHGSLDELLQRVESDADQQKGEFVVLIHGAQARDRSAVDAETLRMLEVLLAELPLKQAAGLAAKISGLSKNVLYEEGLKLKDSQ